MDRKRLRPEDERAADISRAERNAPYGGARAGNDAERNVDGALKRKRPRDQQDEVPKDDHFREDEEGHLLLRAGDVLEGRFVVKKCSGTGTFGKVYLCEDRTTGGTVAIKVIRRVRRYVDSAKIEKDLLEDVNRAIPVPNGPKAPTIPIVRYERSFDCAGHYCMVFEALGPSLYDYVKANEFRPLPLYAVQSFAEQLVLALAFLHKIRLVHTDLKLENILLTSLGADGLGGRVFKRTDKDTSARDGRHVLAPLSTSIKIIDFGGATYDYESKSFLVNTRQYRSPEVILGLGWGLPSDVWSLGCILMELYTGELLFGTHDNAEHLALIERILGPFPVSMLRRDARLIPQYFDSSGRQRYPDTARSKDSVRRVKSTQTLDQMVNSRDTVFLDLVRRMLTIDPEQRITAEAALNHRFFTIIRKGAVELPLPREVPAPQRGGRCPAIVYAVDSMEEDDASDSGEDDKGPGHHHHAHHHHGHHGHHHHAHAHGHGHGEDRDRDRVGHGREVLDAGKAGDRDRDRERDRGREGWDSRLDGRPEKRRLSETEDGGRYGRGGAGVGAGAGAGAGVGPGAAPRRYDEHDHRTGGGAGYDDRGRYGGGARAGAGAMSGEEYRAGRGGGGLGGSGGGGGEGKDGGRAGRAWTPQDRDRDRDRDRGRDRLEGGRERDRDGDGGGGGGGAGGGGEKIRRLSGRSDGPRAARLEAAQAQGAGRSGGGGAGTVAGAGSGTGDDMRANQVEFLAGWDRRYATSAPGAAASGRGMARDETNPPPDRHDWQSGAEYVGLPADARQEDLDVVLSPMKSSQDSSLYEEGGGGGGGGSQRDSMGRSAGRGGGGAVGGVARSSRGVDIVHIDDDEGGPDADVTYVGSRDSRGRGASGSASGSGSGAGAGMGGTRGYAPGPRGGALGGLGGGLSRTRSRGSAQGEEGARVGDGAMQADDDEDDDDDVPVSGRRAKRAATPSEIEAVSRQSSFSGRNRGTVTYVPPPPPPGMATSIGSGLANAVKDLALTAAGPITSLFSALSGGVSAAVSSPTRPSSLTAVGGVGGGGASGGVPVLARLAGAASPPFKATGGSSSTGVSMGTGLGSLTSPGKYAPGSGTGSGAGQGPGSEGNTARSAGEGDMEESNSGGTASAAGLSMLPAPVGPQRPFGLAGLGGPDVATLQYLPGTGRGSQGVGVGGHGGSTPMTPGRGAPPPGSPMGVDEPMAVSPAPSSSHHSHHHHGNGNGGGGGYSGGLYSASSNAGPGQGYSGHGRLSDDSSGQAARLAAMGLNSAGRPAQAPPGAGAGGGVAGGAAAGSGLSGLTRNN